MTHIKRGVLELLSELFRAESDSPNTGGNSLLDLLSDLYRYHRRLGQRFDRDAAREALDIAVARGDRIEIVPTTSPRPHVHLLADGRVRIASDEGEKRVRGQQRRAGIPVESSHAWQFAVRWLGERIAPIPRWRELLQLYCQLFLLERAARGQRKSHRRHSGEGIHHEIWGQFEEDSPALLQLAQEIRKLDQAGARKVLLREILARYPEEARDVPVTTTASELKGAIDPARFPIRILRLLTSLRMDRINKDTAWKEAISTRARAITERDAHHLTEQGRELIALVDKGELREFGQRNGRGELIGGKGLKEIDEAAYQFYQHRGNPDSLAAESFAENELKDEDAPAWMNWHRTPWRFAIEKLWTDRGCLRAPQGGPFASFDQFEESLNEATYAFRTTDVEAVILGFLREQDEAGYADKLIASTRSAFPDDACLEPPLPRTFEFEVPPLPTDPHSSEEWMPQAAAAGSMGYKNHKHLKNARKAGERAANGSVGRDPQGRMWRRDPSDSRLFWYYKPSLIEKNPSRKRRNDRLQRSCDIVTSENSPT